MARLFVGLEATVPELRRYGVVLLGDQQAADELVRDCLIRALPRLHGFGGPANARIWLFATLHALSVTRLQQKRPRRSRPCSCAAESEASMTDVAAALRRLPLEQRSVLFLVSIADLSYQEVGEVLRIPAGSAISLLSAAREQLRLIMRDQELPASARAG